MKKFVLVDYENAQKVAPLLNPRDNVVVFVGAKQKSINLGLVEAMQKIGKRGRYIKASDTGPNALDFYIAYYVGEISAATPNAVFEIISNDKGFDPLVSHLQEKGLSVSRVGLTQQAGSEKEISLDDVVSFLVSMGKAKPSSLKALSNTVRCQMNRSGRPGFEEKVVKDLAEAGVISIVENTKIKYKLAA